MRGRYATGDGYENINELLQAAIRDHKEMRHANIQLVNPVGEKWKELYILNLEARVSERTNTSTGYLELEGVPGIFNSFPMGVEKTCGFVCKCSWKQNWIFKLFLSICALSLGDTF